MQPSEIHLRKELAELTNELKTAKDKTGIKTRITEIESLLGIDLKKEKASIATDEQPEV